MSDTPEMHHIVVTWDLDEGTGLAVRYGEMSPYRAGELLRLASRIVAQHAELLEELEEDDVEEVEYDVGLDDDDLEYDDDEDDE